MEISLEEAYRGTVRSYTINNQKKDAKIPPGAKTGTKIRFSGGGPSNNGQSTDLYLVVTVLPDNHFSIKGDDLTTEMTIDFYTAILGGSVKVYTFAGDVTLTIPAGTQPGTTFRLAGRGMPILKSGKFGDLFVKVKVELPKNLTKEQQELFEKLRKLN